MFSQPKVDPPPVVQDSIPVELPTIPSTYSSALTVSPILDGFVTGSLQLIAGLSMLNVLRAAVAYTFKFDPNTFERGISEEKSRISTLNIAYSGAGIIIACRGALFAWNFVK